MGTQSRTSKIVYHLTLFHIFSRNILVKLYLTSTLRILDYDSTWNLNLKIGSIYAWYVCIYFFKDWTKFTLHYSLNSPKTVKSFYTLAPGFIPGLILLYLSTFTQCLTVLCHHKAAAKHYSMCKDIIKSHFSCMKVEGVVQAVGLT